MSDNESSELEDRLYFDISHFLKEYEKLPCLWDKTHMNFKDRRERALAEEILREKLGIEDLVTLRRKIRSVRGSYNTEIRKVKQSLDSQNNLHVPKLYWFAMADRFLRITTDIPLDLIIPHGYKDHIDTPKRRIVQKLPKKNGMKIVMVKSECKNVETLNDKDKDDERVEFNEEDLEQVTNSSLNSDFHDKKELLLDQTNSYCTSPEYEHLQKRAKVEVRDEHESANVYLANIMESFKDLQKKTENEFDIFGRSVGIQLRSVPLELALQLQTDIQAHITRCRIEYLNNVNK